MRKEKVAKEKDEKEAVRVLEQIEAVSINKLVNQLMANSSTVYHLYNAFPCWSEIF